MSGATIGAAVVGAIVTSVVNRAMSQNSGGGSSSSSGGGGGEGGLNTQQISRFTPEQAELFKKLMNTSLTSGFDPGSLPRMKGPIPRLYRPGAVNSAFTNYGV